MLGDHFSISNISLTSHLQKLVPIWVIELSPDRCRLDCRWWLMIAFVTWFGLRLLQDGCRWSDTEQVIVFVISAERFDGSLVQVAVWYII